MEGKPGPAPHSLAEIAMTNTVARLRLSSPLLYKEVDRLLSYYPEGYRFMRKYKSGVWDGRIHLLRRRDGSFPAGLVPRVSSFLADQGSEVRLYDQRIVPDPDKRLSEGQNTTTLRESQQNAAVSGIEAGRGVFEAATGWGKSHLMGSIITLLAVPTLILVHRRELAYQTLERFEETLCFPNAGTDKVFGMVGDNLFDPGLITIATYQTIYSMLEHDRRGMQEWLRQFKALHLDEAHHVPARTLYATCNAVTEAYFRYGYSATPFKSDKASELRLVAVTGEIIFSFGPQEAIQEGILVPPKIYMIDPGFERLDGHDELTGKYLYSWAKEYRDGIVEHRERNAMIARCAEAAAAAKQPTLVLLQHLAQGRNILRYFEDGAGYAEFYHGSHPTSARKRALKRLGAGRLPILLSSVILEEGIDLPVLGLVIMAGGYRAKHKALQRVGRGLRAAPGKSHVIVIDFLDRHSERLNKHSRSRMAAYRGVGFEVEILPPEALWKKMAEPGFWGSHAA
jgi:superfamily II DNA or RNA helicase